MQNIDPIRIIVTTSPSREVSKQIAHAVLDAKLAACVNIIPQVASLFWWEGKISEESEEILLIKTTCSASPRTTEAIKKVHPYDTPEIVCLSPESVDDKYALWANAAVR